MSNEEAVRESGLYAKEPANDGIPRLHQSIAKILVTQSPLHGWHQAFHPEPEDFSEMLNRGTLCHALLLGGSEIVEVDANDWRTNAAKSQREEALAAGKIPVLKAKLVEARNLAEFVKAELFKRDLTMIGKSELTAIWETGNGVKCQGRLDHFRLDIATIYDFKFCRSANPEMIGRMMFDYAYDIQYAAYTQAIEKIHPELCGKVKFVFVFIETDAPNAITLASPSGLMRSLGQSRWNRACEIWDFCLGRFGT